jgi:chorismate mutase-like protein
MRRIAALVFIGLLLASVPLFSLGAPETQAAAPSRLDEIIARGVLRVGSTGDYKPFSYRPAAGAEFVGLDIALAADLAHSLGVKLDVVPTSWPTLMKDFADDRFDLAIGGISVTLERQKKAMFSLPYLRDGKTPITRCENQARFQTLAQIDQPEVRLIENPGGTNERFARAHAPHARLIVYPDNVTIFEQIASGQADVMITDATEARLQQRLHPALCAVHPDAPFDFSEKAVLLPRDFVLKAYVDQWLHQAEASGAMAGQVDHWLSYPWGLFDLARLIDQRLAISRDVARAKWNSHAPIEDAPREAQIVERLTAQATAAGVPAPLAQRFFRAQIEASKTVQRHLFEQWTEARQGRFADAPDLARDLRPQLDALTPRLLAALADNLPVLQDRKRAAEVAQALSPRLGSPGIDPEAAQQALQPLLPASAP